MRIHLESESRRKEPKTRRLEGRSYVEDYRRTRAMYRELIARGEFEELEAASTVITRR